VPFKDVLNNHPDMICRFDTDLKLTYANNSFAELFGGTVEDHLGKNITNIIEEEGKDVVSKKILNEIAAESMGLAVCDIEGKNTYDLFGESAKKYHEDDLIVINSGKPLLDIVERYTPNNGLSGWVKTDKIPFDHPGSGEKRILVVSTDITRIKEQEAHLQALNQNLDDFASLASHDMQSPLRQVLVLAQLLERELDLSESPTHQSYLDSIQGNVRQMRTMIDSLLKFMRSKPEITQLKPVNLSKVFIRVRERHRLEQVVTNLIENAIKYRDFSRPLEISVSAKKVLGEWVIRVADNGVGVPSNLSSSIFEIFGRAKNSSNREGYGIGLAICKRIVVLHGGTM